MNAPKSSIKIVRTINASASEIFAAWTNPELLCKWLAPGSGRVRRVEVDARVGGHYRIETEDPDGLLHVTTGEYREFTPPHRLVKTWLSEGPAPELNDNETLLSVEFRALQPDVTELTLVHTLIPKAEYREATFEAWASCLDRLENIYNHKQAHHVLYMTAGR